jgi:hypothetical protein
MMVSAIISFQNYTALIYTLSHKLAEACQEATCLTFQERSIIYSVRKLMCTWKSCTGMLLKQNLHRIGVSFMPRVATSRRSVWRAPTPATSLVIDGCCTHLRRSMLRWRRGCHLLDVGTGDASTAWLARRYGRMPSIGDFWFQKPVVYRLVLEPRWSLYRFVLQPRCIDCVCGTKKFQGSVSLNQVWWMCSMLKSLGDLGQECDCWNKLNVSKTLCFLSKYGQLAIDVLHSWH